MEKFAGNSGWSLWLAIVAILLSTGVTHAQPGWGRGSGQERGRATENQPRSVELGEAIRPMYLESDLAIIRVQVDLDDGQAIVVETLLADLDQAFTEGVQSLRVALQQSRPGGSSGGTLEGMREGQSVYDQQLSNLRNSLSEQLRNARNTEERQRIRDEFSRAMEQLDRERAAIESTTGEVEDWETYLARQSALIRSWLLDRRQLEEEFVLSVELILDEQQLDSWAMAQRSIRRRDIPSEGVFPGEGLDLDARVRAIGLEPAVAASIEPMLSEYAISIDEAIQVRNAFLLEAVPVRSDTLAAGNWPRMQSIIQDEAIVRTRLRDLNLQWFEHFTTILPEPQRSAFRDKVRRDAFGSVWNTSRVTRVIEAALQLDGLSDRERRDLMKVDVGCAATRSPLQEKISSMAMQGAASAWIADQERRWARSFTGIEPGRGKPAQASTALREELKSVEATCLEAVKGVLGDERYAGLPGVQARARSEGTSRGGRSEESLRRRDELYRRFDADRDGRLNSDERRKMRDTLQNEQGRP